MQTEDMFITPLANGGEKREPGTRWRHAGRDPVEFRVRMGEPYVARRGPLADTYAPTLDLVVYIPPKGKPAPRLDATDTNERETAERLQWFQSKGYPVAIGSDGEVLLPRELDRVIQQTKCLDPRCPLTLTFRCLDDSHACEITGGVAPKLVRVRRDKGPVAELHPALVERKPEITIDEADRIMLERARARGAK
jgi:hypothetical protein